MLDKDISIMKRRSMGETFTFTLTELRERVEADKQIDIFDWGGCGCFVDPEA